MASSIIHFVTERTELAKRSRHLADIVKENWHLGFTAFGGPSVHFQIFRKKFVDRLGWIDEQIYQELFGLCQATPGPGSTKMLFCINTIYAGWLNGFIAFLIWSLPGAIGMYGLSLGVARVNETLPGPVYALLSGLNAATVGIIALAAIQLSEKAITDRLTRLIVFVGGAVGILYTALWYFPVLMAASGMATMVWDYKWLQRGASSVREHFSPRSRTLSAPDDNAIEMQNQYAQSQEHPVPSVEPSEAAESSTRQNSNGEAEPRTVPADREIKVSSWKTGLAVLVFFLASFITILVVRSVLANPPRGVSVFANMYLAGTIIFGGGPVVIPLLREYVVAEGWVSPRDFLLGLAIIQAFPGPNFNFAVYLGSLSVMSTGLNGAVGALIGYLGIFTPGILISAGLMGVWKQLRSRRWLKSFLRGINALAVGLVYTAVYRLWQTGLIDAQNNVGAPLGTDPWWVTVTATSFVGGRWFGMSPAVAILLGGVLGLLWYAAVKT